MSSTQTQLKFRSTKKASVDVYKENNPTKFKNTLADEHEETKIKDVCRRQVKRTQLDSNEQGNVSPPKRDKSANNSPSPSQGLNKLCIKDETLGDHLLPKQLFGKGNDFRTARKALHSSVPSAMPGRESEIQELRSHLLKNLEESKSGSFYISGPPGTGKTACLTCILQDKEFQGCHHIYVNCTSIKSSGCIFSRICEELDIKVTRKGEKECIQTLHKFWLSNKRMMILILDEIDQLESKKQAVLYTIFEWPSIYNNMVLIGVANALDLTDRTLPRLQAHVKLKPKLVHFTPYTKEQIVMILTDRLKEMDVVDVFSPMVLNLLAGKVASVSGDVRRALDIGRRVLELAEAQKLSQITPLQPSRESDANASSPKKKISGSVDLKIVLDVLNSVYGTSQSLTSSKNSDDSEDRFPLQQKLLVCTLLLVLKRGKNKDISVGKLHEVYRRVCKKKSLVAIGLAEFFSVCQLVETKGILQLQTKKETRLTKVRLVWDEEEVAAAMGDKQLLADVLSDTTVL